MKPGAALASLRRTPWHLCESCGKRFSGIKTAKFCSNACRQKAKYKRMRADSHTAALVEKER